MLSVLLPDQQHQVLEGFGVLTFKTWVQRGSSTHTPALHMGEMRPWEVWWLTPNDQHQCETRTPFSSWGRRQAHGDRRSLPSLLGETRDKLNFPPGTSAAPLRQGRERAGHGGLGGFTQKRKDLGKCALPAKANTSLNRKESTNPGGCCARRISAAGDTVAQLTKLHPSCWPDTSIK